MNVRNTVSNARMNRLMIQYSTYVVQQQKASDGETYLRMQQKVK